MSDSSHARRDAGAAAPWDRQIPEKMLALYLNSVRSFPTWKAMCPHYIHPDVKAVGGIGYHATMLRTAYAEYVFTFSTKTTFIYEIEEEVKTAQLEIRCDKQLVLSIGASCADGEGAKTEWVARSVEVFCDGDWVPDLLGLATRQQAHERRRLQLEKKERQRHAQELTALRKSFGFEETPSQSTRAESSPKSPQGWQRLQFWKKRTS